MEKRIRILLCGCGLLALGCVSFNTILTQQQAKVGALRIGMSPSELTRVMGSGQIMTDVGPTPVPYRVQTMTTDNHETMTVYFYYTHMVQQDGVISDDELTPVVLRNNEVAGWGYDYFNKAKSQRK